MPSRTKQSHANPAARIHPHTVYGGYVASKYRTTLEPMKPAPPVTRMLLGWYTTGAAAAAIFLLSK